MKEFQTNLPQHIAIIMDGNGRWAKQRELERIAGHKEGGKTARKIIEACAKRSIPVLTLFAFGRENWERPKKEVNFLMELFLQSLERETSLLQENNIQLRFIGDVSVFDNSLQKQIRLSEIQTANNNGLTLIIAINYSGQWDILQATKKILKEMQENNLNISEITETYFEKKLSTAAFPLPDLFIRTSGEQRISNFLLWQLAYTELYFSRLLWPDFNEKELEKALAFYAARERRYGLTSEQVNVKK